MSQPVPFPPALDLDMDFFNLYNCKSWGHKPKTNDIACSRPL